MENSIRLQRLEFYKSIHPYNVPASREIRHFAPRATDIVPSAPPVATKQDLRTQIDQLDLRRQVKNALIRSCLPNILIPGALIDISIRDLDDLTRIPDKELLRSMRNFGQRGLAQLRRLFPYQEA